MHSGLYRARSNLYGDQDDNHDDDDDDAVSLTTALESSKYIIQSNPKHSGVTFPGRPHLTLGGVGRNLATAINYLGHQPFFITSLGNDDNLGSFALNELAKVGFKSGHGQSSNGIIGSSNLKICKSLQLNDSCFALVLVDSISGSTEYVIANLDAVNAIDREAINSQLELIKKAPLLVMDVNLHEQTIEELITVCYHNRVPIFMEPTDILALPRLVKTFKSIKEPQHLNSILSLSPNLIELRTMLRLFEGEPESSDTIIMEEEEQIRLDEIEMMAKQLMAKYLPQLKCLLVTIDKRGTLVAIKADLNGQGELEKTKLMDCHYNDADGLSASQPILIKHFQTPYLVDKPISSSGAGDTFAAGFISGLLANSNLLGCLDRGFRAAALTLQDKNNISIKLKHMSSI